MHHECCEYMFAHVRDALEDYTWACNTRLAGGKRFPAVARESATTRRHADHIDHNSIISHAWRACPPD
jgi:hypothetical protein